MESQQKRLMLAVALSFAIITLWTIVFSPKPNPAELAGADGGTAASAQAQAPTPGQGTATPGPGTAAPGNTSGTAQPAPQTAKVEPANLPPPVEVTKSSESLQLTFSSQGAGLTKAPLLGDKMREQPQLSLLEGFTQAFSSSKAHEAPQMDVALPMKGEPLPLSVGLTGNRPLSESARYEVEQSPDGKKLTFTTRQDNVEVQKVLEWPPASVGGFDFAMSVTVKNLGTDPLAGELAVHMGRGVQPGSEVKGGYFSGVGNLTYATCEVGEDIHKKGPDDKVEPEYKGPLKLFGVNQQYFLAAVFPLEGPREGRCVMNARDDGRASTAFFPLQVPAGQSVTQRFGVFIGPKDVELLRSVPDRLKSFGVGATATAAGGIGSLGAAAYPQLDKTVDFGMWAVICKLLLGILKFFHGILGNWGLAIIALTVLVKLVLLPLSHKAAVSAEQMKKLQPKMEEIRKKYADDRERLNVETMKVYQEAKVNPFGGCLPMIIQMPVWIALFATLRNSFELYREPFISPLWADLTYKDPTYILPLALGVTMIVTQRLQPQMMDATQAKIMTWFMPIFFTALMLSYPAGLTLYIFTNNLLSIAQQYGLRKYLERKGLTAPARAVERKSRKDENERQPNRKRTNP